MEKCIICNQLVAKQEIYRHYEQNHQIQFEVDDLQFSCVEEFYDWKRNMQLATNSSYIVSRAEKGKRFKVTTFKCHRSGPQVIKSSDRKIKMKAQGSKKLNAVCPAFIKLRQNLADSNCTVVFHKTHLGHDLSSNELDYIYALRSDRINLVYDKSRDRVDTEDDELLIDFLSFPINRINSAEKDLHVRERSYGEYSYKNYEEILEKFVCRYTESCIYYKKPDQIADEKFPFLEPEDLLLVFMCPSQRMLLQKHGDGVIAIDGIFGTDPFPFCLLAILVLDYDCDGMPAAFAISNRFDACTINIFLACIKEKVGVLRPHTLMTDLQDLYYNCWKSIMDIPPCRLFCTWHVKRAWEQNIKSRIGIEKKRDEMKKVVNDLLIEADPDLFHERLQELLGNADEQTTEFVNYFREAFGYKPQYWGYFFRQSLGLDTNMHVEAFHSILSYLHGREDKLANLYVCLFTMVNCVKRKLLDMLTRAIRGKITRRLRTLRDAHTKYVEFAACNEIRIEVDKDGEKWRIQWSSEQADELGPVMYVVRRLRSTCPVEEDAEYGACNWICKECQVCAHLYSCTCPDSAVKNRMCKHIHAVASIFGFSSIISEFETTEVTADKDFDEQKSSFSETTIVSDNSVNLEDRKEKLLAKLNSVIKIITEAVDEDVLEVIDELLAPVVEVEMVAE